MGSKWKNRIRTFRKYWDLLVELVKRDIKLKYRRSVLGVIWSVLNPLLMMLVMSLVFSFFLNTLQRVKDLFGEAAAGPITGSSSRWAPSSS